MVDRPVEITFAKMRDSGVREILIYCSDYRCSNSMLLMADHRPGDVRLANIEMRFVCSVCGKRAVEIRPNFNRNIQGPIGGMGYR
jgi:hypothetical protein